MGELLIGATHFCYTLEPVYREVADKPVNEWKIDGCTAIPHGTYEVKMQYSQHFQRNVPHLQNVPGFEAVEIHPGNTFEDSRGCILVGYVDGEDNIGQSRKASDDLNSMIQHSCNQGEKVTITLNNNF